MHTVEYYSPMIKNDVLTQATVRVDLDNITRRERNPMQKEHTHYSSPLKVQNVRLVAA